MKTSQMLCACAAVLGLAVSAGFGETITFTGNTDKNWHTTGNQDLDRTPTSFDRAVIPRGKTSEISTSDADADPIDVAATLKITAKI